MSSELTWAPAWRLREMIKTKEVSPVEVVDHSLARIEELDSKLQSFIHLDPKGARAQAKKAEAAVLAGDDLGPLHGVPMAVKSHIEVMGFPRPAPPISYGGVSEHDDIPVERLRRAGAVIVGHNSMPSFTPHGALDLDALARNPWDLSRIPGASSSGGGAAVAAGLVPAVLGTDGGGSTRIPSAFCGIVGLHTTDHVVPRRIDPQHFSYHVGMSVGPMARDTRDAATVFSVIAGPDARDPTCLDFELPDPLATLDHGAAGLKLAWSDDLGFTGDYAVEGTAPMIRAVREAAFALTSIGAAVEETSTKWEDHVPGLGLFDIVFPDLLRAPNITVSRADWDTVMDRRLRNRIRFQDLFAKYDLLLCPAQNSIAPTFEQFRQWLSGTDVAGGVSGRGLLGVTIYASFFNWMAFPAAAVGCGFLDGAPVALQIVGPPGSDAKIFRLAHALRQAFPRNERPAIQ